ncbi:MAG: hypothetical protein BMS9Abin29_0465 [Gemmatimonadota bacterium]|nr:MAG: hypothetical protein BMS9Abin29_0465 [Gemmatimonadota bacterium]
MSDPGPNPAARLSKPPEDGDYSCKREFYRSAEVASHYDAERFLGAAKARRNRRKWATIQRALAVTRGVERVLDLPSGTGRFTEHLARDGYRVAATDISREMMKVGRERIGAIDNIRGHVQAEAERLPFRDGAFDCVVSIRFLHHLDPDTRVVVLREMARVARWLVVDYRHRYSYRFVRWKIRRALGLTRLEIPRVSRAQLEDELRRAGIRLHDVLSVTRVFSDKWIVVGEVPHRA